MHPFAHGIEGICWCAASLAISIWSICWAQRRAASAAGTGFGSGRFAMGSGEHHPCPPWFPCQLTLATCAAVHDLSTREKGRSAGWEVVRGKYHEMRERRMCRAGTRARSPNQQPHRQRRSRPRPWPWVPPPNQCDCNQPKSQRAGNRAGKTRNLQNACQKSQMTTTQTTGRGSNGGERYPTGCYLVARLGMRDSMWKGQRPPQNPNGSTSGTRARSWESPPQPFNQSLLLLISPHVF